VEPYDYEFELEEVYQQLLKESGLELVWQEREGD
jgi:hypothetical protein